MDFGSIKNVGVSIVETIVNERKNKGEFKSFTDFCERMSGETINKRCIESLIKAGAFDEFGDTRATLLASFENIIDTINVTNKKSYQGQVTMFDLGENDEKINNIKYNFTVLEELTPKELLAMEKEMLGIYISGHPLDKIKEEIKKLTNIDTLKMSEIKENNDMNYDGKNIKYAGIISSVKKKYTKRNTVMAFITVEDLHGSTEVIVFDSCYSKCMNSLIIDNVVFIEGKLNIREDEDVKIVANNIIDFNDYKNISQSKTVISNEIEKKKELIVNITNMDEPTKAKLRGAIKFFSGDKSNISMKVKNNEQLLPCGAIYLTDRILKQFEEIVGKDNLNVL